MSGLVVLAPLSLLLAAPGAWLVGKLRPSFSGAIVVVANVIALASILALAKSHAETSLAFATVHGLDLRFTLRLDATSFFGAVIVGAVALPVHVYSLGYMENEEARPRFFAWMAFFVGAMLTLVLAGSLLCLFFAWEWVGLASYALIGFSYHELGAARASKRAFLLTRIGDMGLLLAWLLVLLRLGTTDIEVILSAAESGAPSPDFWALVSGLVVLCVVGKSAQLPLSAWLPDAMVGPSPVSALLHSATMVAAGVYLVLRLHPIFAPGGAALLALAILGGASALVAALVATASMDGKRILAWSTVSQLGEMMLALGLGAPHGAAFHLLTQAFFKSTLFLAAGAVEHATGERDLGRLDGLYRRMPATTAVYVCAGLTLAGLPPFSGHFSEEAILSAALVTHPGFGVFLVTIVFLSGTYISRSIVAVFFHGRRAQPSEARDPAWPMRAPMLVLAFGAFVLGALVHGPLASLLPFRLEAPSPGIGWRMLMASASIAGLCLGGLGALRRGAAPALSGALILPERGLDAATSAAFGAALWLGARVATLERSLDKGARALGELGRALASFIRQREKSLDTTARRTGAFAWALAGVSERMEQRGFARGGDRLALALRRRGMELGRLESGKITMYILWLFLGLLSLSGVAIVVFW